jgi:uracil-DNA glycosylase
MSKQQQLDDIIKQIEADDPTPGLRKGAMQLVFGDGNPDAEIVFIGEAPGKNEDLQGKPFVGAAGRFLEEMLAMIDLKREHVYITNIVKYRPPGNRDPLPDEKQVFLKYLESQLEVIQPVLVVTLGRHSLNCFLPDLSISQCHGQPKKYKGRIYLPLFHPAAALYNGGMRQTLIDDFAAIPAIIEKIKSS